MVYILQIRPHEKFIREGRNLIYPVNVPIHQAFLQHPIEVETLDGRQAPRSPFSSAFLSLFRQLAVLLPCIPTPGYRHVIKGEGMCYPDGKRVGSLRKTAEDVDVDV